MKVTDIMAVCFKSDVTFSQLKVQ